MTDERILEALSRILGIVLENDSTVLTLETRRADVPDWDSFSYVSFIVGVESEFRMTFRVADVESFETAGDIVQVIKATKGW